MAYEKMAWEQWHMGHAYVGDLKCMNYHATVILCGLRRWWTARQGMKIVVVGAAYIYVYWQ